MKPRPQQGGVDAAPFDGDLSTLSLVSPVIGTVFSSLDRAVIRSAARHVLRQNGRAPTEHEAPRIHVDSVWPSRRVAAPNLTFEDETSFHFESPDPSPWPENNRARGRWFPCAKDSGRPIVILIHGWSADLQYRFEFPLLARQLNREGVSALAIELPLHGRRRPSRDGPRNLISGNLEESLSATRQGLTEIQALMAWARSRGSTVGLWGFSMGAWMAGMLACADPAPDWAVLLTPIARMDRAIEELAFCRPLRDGLSQADGSPARLNLGRLPPRIPTDRILLVESTYDQFAPAETVEALWREWNRPEIWRLPHGHISVLFSKRVMNRAARWIAERGAASFC